jgi:hypothetical protein
MSASQADHVAAEATITGMIAGADATAVTGADGDDVAVAPPTGTNGVGTDLADPVTEDMSTVIMDNIGEVDVVSGAHFF